MSFWLPLRMRKTRPCSGSATPCVALRFFISANWALRLSTWRRCWPFSTAGRQPLPWELEIGRVSSLHFLSLGLSGLGYPDRAWAKSREMLEVAQRSSSPLVLATASSFAAFHNLIRGDGAAARKCAEEAMALAEEMGLVSLLAQTIARHGAALIAQGRCEEGIAGMRRGISLSALLEERRSLGICACWPQGSEKSDGPTKDSRCWRRDLLPS